MEDPVIKKDVVVVPVEPIDPDDQVHFLEQESSLQSTQKDLDKINDEDYDDN
jgi:23S rRNA U2552 (ribose-2'-O)-methylase RlmE/FtsJ